MASLMSVLIEQLATGPQLDLLTRSLDADRETTRTAVTAALPMLLGGLAKNASRGEAEPLARALERDHDGGILDQLEAFLGSGQTAPGEGILGHALGSRRPAAEDQLSRIAGLSRSDAARLLALLAPIVMGWLGRTRRREGLDAGGLTELLLSERREVERQVPQAGGMLRGLLDSDGDGQVMDDALDLGGSLLGSFLKRR